MSCLDCCFRSRTSSTASPASSVAFHSSGSCNVVDATYLGRLFIRSANPCSSLTDGHTAAKLSYVTRPRSSASLAKSWSYCIFCSSSFQYGAVQPPTCSSLRSGSSISILPSTERYSAATTRLISHSFALVDCACGLRSERLRARSIYTPEHCCFPPRQPRDSSGNEEVTRLGATSFPVWRESLAADAR